MTDLLDRIAEAIFLTMLYEIMRQNKIDISKKPIDITQQEDKIIITAEIPVIFQVKPENVKVTYSNGVLEITIEKPKDGNKNE
jgi:HSP20 family molecular chaperone IbpA